jgi:uncharacterized protein (DUF433 family)
MLPKVDFTPVSHIEIRDGQARIAGRNLKVKMVISRLFHGTGASIEEVMEQYSLTRSEVHAVIAYYYDHKDAIDAHFEAEDQMADENIPSLDSLKRRLNSDT